MKKSNILNPNSYRSLILINIFATRRLSETAYLHQRVITDVYKGGVPSRSPDYKTILLLVQKYGCLSFGGNIPFL